MDRFSYDEADPPTVAECAQCRGDIRRGDEVYRIDDGGGFVHGGKCAYDYAIDRVYDCYGVIGADGDVE